jgi:hypothetical protein
MPKSSRKLRERTPGRPFLLGSKTEQRPVCVGQAQLRRVSRRSSWESGKPDGFNELLEMLASGTIEEDKPYRVLKEIKPRDAERRDIKGICAQLAFSELRRCLDRETREEIDRITWHDMAAFRDVFQIEKSSGLQRMNRPGFVGDQLL